MSAYSQAMSPPPGGMYMSPPPQQPMPGYGYTSPPPSGPGGYAPGMGMSMGVPQGQYAQVSPVGMPNMGYVPQAGGGRGNGNGFATPPQHSPLPTGGQPMKGTLRPGQEIKVGKQNVVVEKYLSEGGYAHVYLTKSRTPIGTNRLTTHCLKRVAFRDEQSHEMYMELEKEIEVMRALKGKGNIVEYLDSEFRRVEGRREGGPGWEVFILMEFCAGGGIIDLLNKRLRDRLREEEILSIFADVCEAVAEMHALPKPLLHRDLKIENILCVPLTPSIPSTSSAISSFRYKLCDFGSTTYPANTPPKSKREADALAYDLNRHTTLQYRSPEMVEPLLGLPVGLSADVWALGVLLYKLCYYTTPFEEHGPLAIVNAKYVFPPYPQYSPLLQHLIASMLVEQPARRPSVFDILKQVHRMRGTQPAKDFTSQPSNRRSLSPPAKRAANLSPGASNSLDFRSSDDLLGSISPPTNVQAQIAASIQPQRRGRPTRGAGVPVEQPAASQPKEERAAPSIRLQLTGDNNAASEPGSAKSAASDVVSEVKKAAADLTEAFGPTKGKSMDSNKSGFEDRFDGGSFAPSTPIAEPLVKAKTTTTINKDSNAFAAGFGDSFAPSKLGDVGRAESSKTIALPVSEERKAQAAAREADGDTSFESRFPSLEVLASRHSDTPQVVFTKSPEPARDPLPSDDSESLVRPSKLTEALRQRSFHQPSLTGGSNNEQAKHRFSDRDSRPLARSGQVTGTAFKVEDMSTSPISAYKQPVDLLDSLDSPEQQARGPSPVQEKTPHLPPRPREVATAPKSPSMSARSPVREEVRAQQSPPQIKAEARSAPPVDLLTGDSRDSPELAYYSMRPTARDGGIAKSKPQPAAKPAGLANSSGGASVQVAPPQKQSSLLTDEWTPLKDAKARLSEDMAKQNAEGGGVAGKEGKGPRQAAKPEHLRRTSGSSTSRPQTIHVTSPERTPAAVDAASTAAAREASPSGRQPGSLSRSNSITAIVSRYETISSPKQETNGFDLGSQKPRGSTVPKPAPKPAQLRAGQGEAEPESGSGISRSRTMYLPASKSGGLVSSRRESAEKSQRPSELSPGLALRRSSSRSVHSISEDKEKEKVTSGNEVDEKPKSVGSLIARWNQAAPPAQGTPASASRTRAPIGSGRRL